MTGDSALERIRAEHPAWTIRRKAGPEWVAYVAQRVLVLTAPTPGELETRLAAAEPAAGPRVTAARELLAEPHQPLVMTPGDLRQLLARYQRRLAGLLEVIEQ